MSDPGNLSGVYYVDHLDHDCTTVIQTLRPENLDFELTIRDQDTITYEISLGATDIDDSPIISHDFIGPWRTCWQLRCGNEIISAGPHAQVNGVVGEDFMKVSGVSWEGYFNRRHQPFDARTTHVNDFVIGTPPQGLHYEYYDVTAATDISHVVKALFDAIFDQDNSLPITYTRADLGFGITHYAVSLGDFTYFLSMLQDLGNNVPGFDFWVTPGGRALVLGSPFRFGDTPGVIAGGSGGGDIIYAFDDTDLADRGVSLEFTNTGPEKTHTVGTGSSSGQGTVTGVSLGTPAGNETVYFRLDGTYDAGDQAVDPDVIESMTRQDFALGLQPQHEIPLSVDPSEFGPDTFWATFKKGLAVWLNYDLGFHEIDSPQRIVSMHGHTDNNGNMIVDFGLNQIYDLDPTVGVYEG